MSVVIDAVELRTLLVLACPSSAVVWSSPDNEDADAPGGRLGYIDAGDFVRHLVSLQLAGDTSDFPAVFDVIERLVLEGDPYVSTLAVFGYLEDLLFTVASPQLDPERDFRPWLRPESERQWQRVKRFWEETAAARDDRVD
jgi:hypothetical protein